MNKEKISEIIGGIDEKYVAEASSFAPGAAETDMPAAERAGAGRTPAKRTRRIVWFAAAACICVAALGIGGFAAAARLLRTTPRVVAYAAHKHGLAAKGVLKGDFNKKQKQSKERK